MLKPAEVRKFANKLSRRFPEIKLILQFGSSVSGDFIENLNDVDLAIVIKSKKTQDKVNKYIFGEHSHFELQTHVFSIRSFIRGLKQSEPLSLSILYTSTPLYGKAYHARLKKRNFRPNRSTVRKCMLNSFAPLSLAISDMTHGMLYDSVNTMYHAARSSIWATLFNTHITPNNRDIFRLLRDKKIIAVYRKIVQFRQNIPDYEQDFDLALEIYKKGNINQFTQIMEDATTIIKENYKKNFGKNFVGLFELLKILNKKYETPTFYSVFLSVDWQKETLIYLINLSFENDKRLLLNVDANNGKIKKVAAF